MILLMDMSVGLELRGVDVRLHLTALLIVNLGQCHGLGQPLWRQNEDPVYSRLLDGGRRR